MLGKPKEHWYVRSLIYIPESFTYFENTAQAIKGTAISYNTWTLPNLLKPCAVFIHLKNHKTMNNPLLIPGIVTATHILLKESCERLTDKPITELVPIFNKFLTAMIKDRRSLISVMRGYTDFKQENLLQVQQPQQELNDDVIQLFKIEYDYFSQVLITAGG